MDLLAALIRSFCHPAPRTLEYVAPMGVWTW